MAEDGGFQRVEAPDGFKRVEPVKAAAGFTRVDKPEEEPGNFDYFGWLKKYAGEGIQQFREGMHRDGPGLSMHDVTGPFQAGAGLFKTITSPITAAGQVADRTVERGFDAIAPAGADLDKIHEKTRAGTQPSDALSVFGFGGLKKPPKLPSFSKPQRTSVEKIFSPGTVSPEAGQAEASIRGNYGRAARDTETTRSTLEDYRRLVNNASEQERIAFIDYVEGRSTKYAGMGYKNPQSAGLADSIRDALQLRRTKLENMPSTSQTHFIEDYYPHFWEDPVAAKKFIDNWGPAGKQGSGASLKKRSMPTVADGIRGGLKPLTTDPIEATMKYIESMDHFIASTSVLEEAKAAGTVKYIRPKTVGASGHPDSFKVPEGYVALEGRGATNAIGEKAYAPEDWARVYNNFISRGFHAHQIGGRDVGPIYDKLQRGSNTITSLELGLSGYHAFTMANEAVISQVAKGIGQIIGGRIKQGLGSIGTAVFAPVSSAVKGHKFEQIYLGKTAGTPDWRRIVDLGTDAGMRAKGNRHAADYRYSAMGSYWTAFKRGALKAEMTQSYGNIKNAPNLPRAIGKAASEGMKQLGRIMETVAQPLFEKYIPKLKNGAFYDTMQAWIDTHPQAGYDEQVAAARQIWNSIDNRFGEMVQDNIFWNKILKQSAQLGMRSYSWNLGTVREIGGGVKDIAATAMGKQEWSPRASYVVAMPIVVGTMNAAYQYLKTGKGPESVEDLVAGRTGGMDAATGKEERAQLPGYQKDVLGWYHDWRQEAKNKVATGPRMVADTIANKDWRGDPIVNPNGSVPEWLNQYFDYVTNSLGPISLRQAAKGPKTGSNISTAEGMTGIRPAGRALTDPEGYDNMMHGIGRRDWQKKQRHDKKQESQYGGYE